MEWYRFLIEGTVQHVFYRKFVLQAMMRAGFNGYVRNLDDGRVECVVFLTDVESEIPQILQILEEGSPMSKVEKIDYETLHDIEIDIDGFEIRYE